ncbi:MAG: T9SS type A sorting domain-containing protein [FCB group bacterium]|nr:T9SS type A sorting domain-containing protein [FCB group bacterium]
MKKTAIIVVLALFMVSGLFAQLETIADGWSKTFGQTTHPGAPYPVVVTQAVSAGWDIDKDGFSEFIVLSDHSNPNGGGPEYPTGCSVWLYEANTSGGYDLAWSWWDTTLYTGGASFPVHAVTDLDGDGNLEIVVGVPYGSGNPPDGSNPARFYVWEGPDLPSTPTATWNFDVSVGSNTRPSGIAVDDIDGDGAQEVAMAFRKFSDATSNDAMMIFSLSGSFAGTFTQWNIEMIDTTSDVGSVYSVTISDVDNDGNKEAFFATDYGIFFETDGADSYVQGDQYQLKGGGVGMWALQATTSFDLDGNGSEELVVSPWSGDINVMSEVADLASADSSDVSLIATIDGGTRGMAVGDFDGDGLGEIFIGNNYNGSVWKIDYLGGGVTDAANYSTPEMIYQQDTTGSIRTYSVAFGGADLNGGTTADLNGDNKPDLVIGFEDGDTTATQYVVVLSSDNTVAVDADFGAPILNAYKLGQNYPNPFNPTTTISFNMTKAGYVELGVYDLSGRKVATLVSEYQGAGDHSVVWDGRDVNGQPVASGVYLYRLEVNGAVLTRQMTLLK